MVPKPTIPVALFFGAMLLALLFHVALASQTDSDPPADEVSSAAAASLGRKISRILAAERSPGRSPSADSLVVSDEELESFVLYSMRDDIIPRIDSIDVILEPGVISAATDLFFDSVLTSGNPLIDGLAQGSHNLFLEGALRAHDGEGQFELRKVRVDGIPVPLFLVDLLIGQYVLPRHPQVDIDKPFRVPWGIEGIGLSSGTAMISY